MTPPKKKSGSGAKGKKRAPGTGKGASKSGSRSGGKAAPSTSSSKTGAKKSTAKKSAAKKQRRHPAEYVALAFFLGLVVASAVFLLMRPPGEQTAKTGSDSRILAKSEKTGSGQSPLPKIPPQKVKEAARKTSPPKTPGQSGKTGTAPKAGPAAAPPDKGKAADPSATTDTATRLAERNKAVASALIDMKSLPYEESPGAGLDERIRQVDYALMQAGWLRKLPASAMRLSRVEDRLEGTEPYHYQVIDILPGKSSKDYVKALRECLAAWAEGAELQNAGREQWSVAVKEIQTHLIRLHPGRNAFPPSPDAAAGVEPLPDAPAKTGWSRVRKPGEEARLVIVIDDLGASSAALRSLMSLDYPVTFAFWPHGAHTRKGAMAAHAAGHEILVHQPMEPVGYPKVRPGPNVLLVNMDEGQIRRTLAATLAAVPYAVGLNNHMGSRFTQDAAGVDAVLSVLRERGLFMLDSLTHGRSVFADRARRLGIEHYRRNVFLDVVATEENVVAQLRHAERIALLTGRAVAIGHPLPETLAALKDWQRLRNKEVRIVRLRDLEQE